MNYTRCETVKIKQPRALVFCACLSLFFVAACKKNENTKGLDGTSSADTKKGKTYTIDGASQLDPGQTSSALLQGMENLPTCTPLRAAQLVFVLEEQSFYHCAAEKWNPIDIQTMTEKKGAQTPALTKSYRYNAPSIRLGDLSDVDLCGECQLARIRSLFRAYITDITVREFKDNTVFMAVSGIYTRLNADNNAQTDGGNVHREEDVFTFSDIGMVNEDGSFEMSKPLDRAYDMKLYVRFDKKSLSATATIDIDENLADNLTENNFKTLSLTEM